MQTSPIYELQEIIASKDAKIERLKVFAVSVEKAKDTEIKRLVNLIKDVHKAKILLMALDGNTGEEHNGEMEAITNLWNRIKQVYRDYPEAAQPQKGQDG